MGMVASLEQNSAPKGEAHARFPPWSHHCIQFKKYVNAIAYDLLTFKECWSNGLWVAFYKYEFRVLSLCSFLRF